MAQGAAILAKAGLDELASTANLKIDLYVNNAWVNDVATAGASDVSRSTNVLTIAEDVDYTNNDPSTKTVTQARVRLVIDGGGIIDGVLFPAKSIGSQELLEGQILRFTNISCNLNS